MTDKMPDDLREVLFKGFTGCTNHSCIITGPKTGMGTNGSCHCLVNFNRSQLNILQSRLSVVLQAKYIPEQKHAEEIAALKAEHQQEIEQLGCSYSGAVSDLRAEHRAKMAGLCDEIADMKGRFSYGSGENYGFDTACDDVLELIKQRISDE